MKSTFFLTVSGIAFFGIMTTNAQINLNDRVTSALQNGIASFTFSDSDATKMAMIAVGKLDTESKVAGSKDPYTIRLEKIFGKHKNENGLDLNYKVYLVKEVNAFATADGSVRVFSGLMDIMDDNELLAVIGHEIGHVVNHDSRDAIKAAYQKEALINAAASQSENIAALTDGQMGKIVSSLIDRKYNRKQESDADLYSYEFLKRNGYNVNAEEAAFNLLAKRSEGNPANFLDKMMSSHPDAKERAENAKKRAHVDGLYQPYTKGIAKTIAKKPTKNKKSKK